MIYGYYQKTIRREFLSLQAGCTVCGSKKMYLETCCRINHFIYIPVLPNNKYLLVNCCVCEHKFSPDAFPEIKKQELDRMKSIPYPLPYYTGIFLAFLFVLSTFVLIWQGQKSYKKSLYMSVEEVGLGSIIAYKLNNDENTCMYVIQVKGDSLMVRQNKFSIKKNRLDLIDLPENYTDKITVFTKHDLYQLIEQNKLSGIYKTTSSIYFNPEIFE